MIKVSLLLIFVCTTTSRIFNQTADDIFGEIIGDVKEFKGKVNPSKSYKSLRTFQDFIIARAPSDLTKSVRHIPNTSFISMRVFKEKPVQPNTRKPVQVTQLPVEKMPNITTDEIKQRMLKINLNQLLKETSDMPDFGEDMDNPATITRRFDSIPKEETNAERPDLRQLYFESQNATRMRGEKDKAISIMEHFIYVTRYKLPYLQLLRKKYNWHVKYKIGFCFALMRHLKQQQKLIYNGMHKFYKNHHNLMYHIRLYEKVFRLDVDIKDLFKLIKRFNYEKNLEENSDYYVDTNELTTTTKVNMPGRPRGREGFEIPEAPGDGLFRRVGGGGTREKVEGVSFKGKKVTELV